MFVLFQFDSKKTKQTNHLHAALHCELLRGFLVFFVTSNVTHQKKIKKKKKQETGNSKLVNHLYLAGLSAIKNPPGVRNSACLLSTVGDQTVLVLRLDHLIMKESKEADGKTQQQLNAGNVGMMALQCSVAPCPSMPHATQRKQRCERFL